MSFFNRLNKQFKEQKLHNLEEVRFQSGMTSEQKYQSITQSVLAKIDLTKQSIKGCPMHPKISKKCRKCNEIQSNLQKAALQEEVEVDDRFPEMIKVNTANMKSHFSQKLQKNIQDCYLFKSKLRTFNNVRDLVKDLTSDQISIDAYINGSTDTPTPFFFYFYRLTELRPTREQISIMLKANNVNVRCLALLYLRTYASPQIVYGCLCNSFKDNKLLSVVTVGQYAMRLFDQEQLNHGGFRLPRLPIKIQRAINKRIAKLKEQRQNQFERQRERSRERQRKRRQQYEEQVAPSKKRKESESQSEQERQYQQKPIIQKDEQPLSLKQRIRLMQKKKQEELRKKALLDSYRNENVNKLQSEEEAFSQNDDVQKFNVG